MSQSSESVLRPRNGRVLVVGKLAFRAAFRKRCCLVLADGTLLQQPMALAIILSHRWRRGMI